MDGRRAVMTSPSEEEVEERDCTCGAGHGSLEGHTKWCAWIEAQSARQAKKSATAFQDMEFLKENGEVGDCVRASTATILRIDRSEVPHFVRDHSGHWRGPWEDFVRERGYCVVEIDPRQRPDCDFLACGPTERSTGDGTASHMVVMNWIGLLHDPHPSRKGLTGIDRVYLLVPTNYSAAYAVRSAEPVAWRWAHHTQPNVWQTGNLPPPTDPYIIVEPLYLAPPSPTQERVSEWQDISTAPKDGTHIIGLSSRDGDVMRLSWGHNRHGVLCWCTSAGWRSEAEIKHWMPIPAPPALIEKENGHG
jgi:hypothetical protein